MHGRNRGRPPLAPELRRHSRGIRLRSASWDDLKEIAGAYVGPDTLARAWAKGIKPPEALAANDGHGFFSALGDSVITGPTLTNVNDFRAILIAP